jgi:DNA-binding CsgD family transcriptional regulator/tetratricopeptide (TPR) repeat protein
MTTTGQRPLITSGNEALARGAWAEARAAFEQAIAETETAEAHEALSEVATWLNDGDAAIRSRETAYRLYREAGDDLSAARMAIWVSTDYEDIRGDFSIAQGWRHRARRLLEGQPVAPEHGLLCLIEGESALLVEDNVATAQRYAEEAIALSRTCGTADIQLTALAMQGLSLVGEGRVEEGIARLDEAAAAALGGELENEAWANKILCYLIFACEWIRDFDRATQWCEKMRQVADRMQFTFAQGVCRAHYGAVLTSRGNWTEAERQFADATVKLRESRPAVAVESMVRLAELRRRQGRVQEATALFRQFEWHPLAILGLAEIALDDGRPRDAEELAERFLRQIPESSRLQRATALELLVRAEALLANYDRAAAALSILQDLSESVATPPLRAAAWFAAGMIAVAAGEYDVARVRLEDAVGMFEQAGTPYESARARLELAQVLVVLDRRERARGEAEAASQVFARLGATLLSRRAAALLEDLDRRASANGSDTVGSASLTQRQQDILRCIAQGMSDREIAVELGLSEHTVHRHVSNILLRLSLPSRAAAVAHAASRGLL